MERVLINVDGVISVTVDEVKNKIFIGTRQEDLLDELVTSMRTCGVDVASNVKKALNMDEDSDSEDDDDGECVFLIVSVVGLIESL